jgi:hypothetical protein
MSFTTIDIQRFVSNAIEKASIDNKMEIKFDLDLFMKNINNVQQDERRDDVVELVVKKDNASEDKKKLTKEERLANKEAKEATKNAKEAEKKAKEQAKADKLAAKEAEKQAKEQAKADKLAAKEAEKQAKEQAKADKLAAKEAEKQAKVDKKKEKNDSKPKSKRGRPKKDNIVVASGDYIENVEAQSVDLIENLAQNVQSESNDSTANDDSDKFEDVQVHLFEYNGVMYYKSDDHVLYHHESQEELGNWDPIENEIVLK